MDCDAQATSFLIEAIRFWQASSNLKGLPIGPEASAVAGNLFLNTIDMAIQAAGLFHLRYGDDILVFCENPAICDAVAPFLDGELSRLDLLRSAQKTKQFYDPHEAAADLREKWLASLGSSIRPESESPPHALRRAFDREIRGQEVKPNVFHWIITTLKNKADSYGCLTLACDPRLMNIDPKMSADYLRLALNDDRIIEACIESVSKPPEQEFQALVLHLLRILSTARVGRVQGQEFEKVACDDARPWPVRAWAWTAYAKSDARRDAKLMEAAREEREPNVRRAIVASLKPSQKGRRHKAFIQHAQQHFFESRFTAQWLSVA